MRTPWPALLAKIASTTWASTAIGLLAAAPPAAADQLDGISIATRSGPLYYAPPPSSYRAPHGRYVVTYRYAPRRGVVYDAMHGFVPSYDWPVVHRVRPVPVVVRERVRVLRSRY